uniref:Uncharacterized protein n=1 Tax=Coccidioides posadasii RMSCC 3488 TaxID=454284 RepID=A0A0J6IJD5_COCPO|nr:hypothetical protein CPAG_08316 [Coccidioides posadasii RMSCC 3488]
MSWVYGDFELASASPRGLSDKAAERVKTVSHHSRRTPRRISVRIHWSIPVTRDGKVGDRLSVAPINVDFTHGCRTLHDGRAIVPPPGHVTGRYSVEGIALRLGPNKREALLPSHANQGAASSR